MKIRHGFVSNSSSTSFVVFSEDYTIRELAIKMMEIRNGYWDDYDDESMADLVLEHTKTGDGKTFREIKEAINGRERDRLELEALKNSDIDPNFPIAFHTTNYDTYIMKSDKYLLVASCNNHYWYNEIDLVNASGVDLEGVEFGLQYETAFWWPKIDKVVKQFRNKDCKKCDRDNKDHFDNKLVMVDGKWACPICDLKLGWL